MDAGASQVPDAAVAGPGQAAVRPAGGRPKGRRPFTSATERFPTFHRLCSAQARDRLAPSLNRQETPDGPARLCRQGHAHSPHGPVRGTRSLHGCRDDAIQGPQQIGERLVASGADTVVILDTHWISNAACHVNAWGEFQGVFTSSEFPTQIEPMEFDHVGHPRWHVRSPPRPAHAAWPRWPMNAACWAWSTARWCRCTS